MSEMAVQEDVRKDGIDDAFWENYHRPPSEEEIEKTGREYQRELEPERRATIVFDAGSGKKMTLSEFESFYGTDEFSEELIKAAGRGEQYSKETYAKIKRLYSRKQGRDEVIKPKRERPKKPEQPGKTKPKQEQFLKVPYRFLDKVKDSGCHRNPTTLLMTLMQHRAWPGKMDKNYTDTYWYRKKRKIVASRSIEQLTRDMGVSEKSIRRFIVALAENGDIEKEKGFRDGYKRDNIYVLGEVDADGNEILYHDQG